MMPYLAVLAHIPLSSGQHHKKSCSFFRVNGILLFAHDYVLEYKQLYNSPSFGKSSDLVAGFSKIN